MTITQATSAKVLSLTNNGMPVIEALKSVCGVEVIDQMIDSLYHELRVREGAAGHLSGIPARQNASTIDKLYDDLNHLHVAKFETVQ